MNLDVTTLTVMACFVAACAGTALLVAWTQNRGTSALALWGIADIGTGVGILLLMFGSLSHQPIWPLFGAIVLALTPGLIWKAAQGLDRKPAPLIVVLLGAAVVTLAINIPAARHVAGALSLAAGSAYLFAAAAALWRGRKERLAARSPLVLLTGAHAAVLLLGTTSAASGALAPGALPTVTSLFGVIHFENIVFTLGTAVFLLALVKERNEAASRTAARIDSLTGIANRAAFLETAERVVSRCRRESLPVSVLMWDLDRFKAINNTHGHAVGDAVIRQFCDVVAAVLRPNDVFGRMGGEEFAAVLARSSIEAAAARAERIRIAFAESCRFVENDDVDATVSCGLAASLDGEETLSTLLGSADRALYRSKSEGRNRVKRAEQPKQDGRVIRVA
ncbi:MAG: GGDEF domain-containing protein [Methylovirgula sp.]